ncbi:MAG TPA: amino acid permease [Rickettsiales bacterium]|nr:amino acid permease [Rickettsiales bacterium]
MSLARYFIRKPMAAIQEESANHELKRTLNAVNLVSLGIGCIIGAGIFVLTGQAAAQHAGPAIVLSFILSGLACTFAGLCYAELASALPVSGSAYTYAYATLGETIAWAMGWLLILEYGLASATVAVGWSGYIVSFLKDFGVVIPPALSQPYFDLSGPNDALVATGHFNLPALIGIMAVTSLLVIGVSESAKVNNVIVFVKLFVVLTFIAIGACYIDTANWHPFIPENTGPGKFGFDGILKGAGVIFFAYIGFESVSTAAQEAKNPQRDMPIGILGSLLICTLLYMIVSAVLTGIVPYKELNVPDPMAVAIDRINVPWLTFGGWRVLPMLIKLGAVMGLSSVMLVLLYSQTRIFYMMGKDGLIPQLFCKLHPKFRTPYINTILVGLIVGVAASVTPISVLGNLVSMGTLFAFCIVCFSVLYLHYKHPELPRSFRTPFMPFIPLLGILACGYLIYGVGKTVFVTLWFYFVAGIVVYLLYSQFNSKLGKAFKAEAV